MTNEELIALDRQVTLLEDIQEIENLQKIYGYFFDNQMYAEVLDLFSESIVSHPGLDGQFFSRAHIREVSDRFSRCPIKVERLSYDTAFMGASTFFPTWTIRDNVIGISIPWPPAYDIVLDDIIGFGNSRAAG